MNTAHTDNWITADEYIEGMVSVVIPNYNHAKFLPHAIDSILNQTYTNYEIIVVDDGSTDNSRQVAEGYGDQIVYIYKDNAGLSAARNTGIRRSKGEFIGLLDADDMYEPSFMQTMVGLLQQNLNKDGAYCGYQFVSDEGILLSQIENRIFPEETLYQTFWGANYWVPESVLMRRRCYVTAGPYDESLRSLEDWDVWLRILAVHPIIGTPDVLIRHRALPESMSSNPFSMVDNRLMVMKKHFGTIEDPHPEFKNDIHWIYSNAYFTATIEHLQAKENEGAFDFWTKAAAADPALLTRSGVYYELAAGSHPKGSRGDLTGLDLAEKETLLVDFLTRLFDSSAISIDPSTQNEAFGLAYFNLGKLAYTGNKNGQARAFLRKAVSFNNRIAKTTEFVGLYARSIVGAKTISRLKGQ